MADSEEDLEVETAEVVEVLLEDVEELRPVVAVEDAEVVVDVEVAVEEAAVAVEARKTKNGCP